MSFGLIAGASVLGSLFGASSADKAADAQAEAARQADETNRYIYDNNVALTEPQRAAGELGLNALLYQYGLGPQASYGGDAPYQIQEINDAGQVTQEPIYRQGGQAEGELIGYRDVTTGGGMRYGVGDQVFDTREGAQQYLDGLPRTGGTPIERVELPGLPDMSIGAFQESPGYQFQIDEGMNALTAYNAARGMRNSGAAQKSVLRFSQGLADQEYDQFRNYQTQDYNRAYGAGMDNINALRSIAGLGESATNAQISAGNTYSNNAQQNALQIGQAQANGAIGVSNALNGGINSLASAYGMRQSGYFDPVAA